AIRQGVGLGIRNWRPVGDVKQIEIVGWVNWFRAIDHRPILWRREKRGRRRLKASLRRAGAEKGGPHQASSDAEGSPATHCLFPLYSWFLPRSLAHILRRNCAPQ